MALILEVDVNGERFAVAGEDSLAVLNAIVSASGKLGASSHGSRHNVDSRGDIDLRVGGLTSRGPGERDEHLRWGRRIALEVGDTVTIRVAEGSIFDAPSHRDPVQNYTGTKLSARKRYFDAKSLYLRMRGKFDVHARKLERQWLRRQYFNLR